MFDLTLGFKVIVFQDLKKHARHPNAAGLRADLWVQPIL